jgi:hypothetical protein
MANKLSHSQIRLFQECGKKYQYYYKDKLREKVRSGALCYGEAFDRAVEAIIKDPTQDGKSVFDKAFETQEINKRSTYLPDSLLVVYSYSDYDRDLLQPSDVSFLEAKSLELDLDGKLDSSFSICLGAKKQAKYKPFKENQRKFYNLCNWMALRRKGHVMLDSFKSKVLPNLKETEGTQVKIELVNDTGDTVIGFADYVGKYADNPNRLVLDFKTSSVEYEDDSATISPQLALYAHSLDIKQAGFVVFSKRIAKNRVKICSKCGFDGSGNRMASCNNTFEEDGLARRCKGEWTESISPEAEVKVIISDIPQQTTDIVLENAEIVNTLINQGLFIRNLESCKGKFGICPYYNKCFRGEDKGLEKL